MENEINIAEILKDCPEGTNLYSPLFGEGKLKQVDSNAICPIRITANKGEEISFYYDGRYLANYLDAECLLFPSSGMHDWTRFFKRGDVVIKNGGGMAAVFDGWANDTYTEFNTTVNLYCDNNTGEEEVCTTLLFRKATEEERNQFIEKVERILKGKYNPETLQVEPVKPVCLFNPFEKVLVRDNEVQLWKANYFSHYEEDDEVYPYTCIDNSYHCCIPYENNKHLLGTSEAYTEGGSV
jgi:hypothetical protein